MTKHTLKRVLLYICALLFCFLLVDRLAALALNSLLKQSEFRYSKLYRGGMDADIIILGNSRSVNAFFVPEMEASLGKEVFHLGFNGMSMAICETVLSDYLANNETPDVVLIEVTNMNVSNGQLKDQKLYRGLSPQLSDLLDANYPIIGFFCGLSNLYQFNSELLLRSLFYYNRSDQAWINGGTMNAELLEELQIQEDAKDNMFALDSDGWPALSRIIENCQAQGIELRLVISPYLPQYIETLPMGEWVAAFRDALPDDSNLYDFHTALKDPSYFADIVHINRRGSIALLNKMIEAGVVTVNK